MLDFLSRLLSFAHSALGDDARHWFAMHCWHSQRWKGFSDSCMVKTDDKSIAIVATHEGGFVCNFGATVWNLKTMMHVPVLVGGISTTSGIYLQGIKDKPSIDKAAEIITRQILKAATEVNPPPLEYTLLTIYSLGQREANHDPKKERNYDDASKKEMLRQIKSGMKATKSKPPKVFARRLETAIRRQIKYRLWIASNCRLP
jgi:hypothetical protein